MASKKDKEKIDSKALVLKPESAIASLKAGEEEAIADSGFKTKAFESIFSLIDGLSEQELMNKMNHMSMVANAYDTNHKLSQSEIVDLLATGFSGTLRSWWDKHLTEDSREEIRKAVKKTEDGLPIFDERVGRGEPDCVNTLIYTIIKHWRVVGQLVKGMYVCVRGYV
jgi:hypothetical protein